MPRPSRVANDPAANLEHKPSLSNLQLQIALYHNCLYSLIYTTLIGAIGIEKATNYGNSFHGIILIIWFLMEPIRLYYGIAGNLNESVPKLSTFLLMTIFPQFPLVIYLAYVQSNRYPCDSILGTFMVLFLIAEFIFGLSTSRSLIRSQTAQFMRLVEHED